MLRPHSIGVYTYQQEYVDRYGFLIFVKWKKTHETGLRRNPRHLVLKQDAGLQGKHYSEDKARPLVARTVKANFLDVTS